MPRLIQSASFITIESLVDCKSRLSNIPVKFTIPVIKISPASGRVFLFTPIPGFKLPIPSVIYPIWALVPREASTAIISASGCFFFIFFRVSSRLTAWTGLSNVPYIVRFSIFRRDYL